MRRLRFSIFSLVFVCFTFLAHASNMTRDLIGNDTFHQLMPRQEPLTELFASIVNSPPVSIRRPQKTPIRIAILLFGETESVGNKALLLSFKQRMRELNIDYRLDIYADNSEFGEDVSSYLKIKKMSPDYIVVTKLGFVQRRFLDGFLHSNKTKVILYDFATPLTYWVNHSPLMYVGFDQRQVAKQLASYLDRQLPQSTKLSALVLADNYLGHMRCDVFLDEMNKYGRTINSIDVVQDVREDAFVVTRALLDKADTDFIFSCSANISAGVIAALQEQEDFAVQTNSWGLSEGGVMALASEHIKVSVLFMKDYLSIALAEAIKLDLEGRNMPNLYIARSTLVPSELDPDSLQLIADQAYPYSVMLWQK
jgi:autoinducer 2-binding protein LuxP